MSMNIVFVLLISLSILVFASQDQYVPAFLWSGTNSKYFSSNYNHMQKCSVSDIKRQILNGKFRNEAPNHIIVFLQEKMNTQDFSRLIDASSANPSGGRFPNLMRIVKTQPSEVSASCEIESFERFDEILSALPEATVVTEKLEEYYRSKNPINFSKFENLIKEGKLGKYIFVFFGVSTQEEVAHNDALMNQWLEKMTQDYVAIYTTNSLGQHVENIAQIDIGRQILSVATIEQTVNTTGNSTYFDDEPMLVDEQVLAGVIACSILIAIFLWGFCWLNCIWGAPHIENPFENLQQKMAKKRN